MKLIICIALLCAVASAAPTLQAGMINDVGCTGPTNVCGDLSTLQSVVVQHYGDDYQAGDMLYDQINELLADDDESCRREIILKCKHAGCKFFLSATTTIDLSGNAFLGGLKIRGLLKDGRRPIIWNTGPINVVVGAANIFHLEKVNIQADGFSSSSSNINISGSADGTGMVLIDECDIIGHSAGYGNGGAININFNFVFSVDIRSSKLINNAAKLGGALYVSSDGSKGCLQIRDSAFIDNAAIEQGGAIWLGNQEAFLIGNHFKGNTANKKGDNYVGEGGAIYCEDNFGGLKVLNDQQQEVALSEDDSKMQALYLFETRTHGGNSAQFGNFLFADKCDVAMWGFGCYEGPFSHSYGVRGDYESYDSYHAYPVCSADSYDSYAPREDLYLKNQSTAWIKRTDLPGGVICDEDSSSSQILRTDCGSYVQSYHCKFIDTDEVNDKPIEAEDYDRDGFDCRYDCNDLWDTVNPAAAEQCNKTSNTNDEFMASIALLVNPRGYHVNWVIGDSNCNGLSDEFVDTDGDWVPDDVDRCPLDYWKIDPGMCGCGIEETDGCAAAGAECGTTEYGGIWYYMCEGNWWYWGDSDWVYGGTY